jgi:hypothetical protein
MKLGKYAMPLQSISAAYLIKLSLQSMSIGLFFFLLLAIGSVKCILPSAARQRFGKYVPAATNACNNKRILDICVCGSACVSLSRHLVTTWEKKFPWQRSIFGDIFYTHNAILK